MTEIVAEISQQARRSPHVNQRSGVSVRLSIANYETLVANAMRRALRNGEHEVVPRVCDLDALVVVDRGQDRDRDARRRPRRPGARAHHEGERARGVPVTGPAPSGSPSRARVRRRPGRAHRRRRAVAPSTRALVDDTRRPRARRSAISTSARRPAGFASGDRVRARRPAPHEAAQQGRRRRPRHVPRPRLSVHTRESSAPASSATR